MRILDESCGKNSRIHMKKLILIGALILVSTALISIVGCGAQETAREGYRTYSKYGFSFEYPKSFLAFEEGFLESEANDTSGIVTVGVVNDEYRSVDVCWVEDKEQSVGLETGLDAGFDNMDECERGELVETTKEGHPILYQYYTATLSDIGQVCGISGIWYCGESQRYYVLMTWNNRITSEKDVLADYLDYLDRFVCH